MRLVVVHEWIGTRKGSVECVVLNNGPSWCQLARPERETESDAGGPVPVRGPSYKAVPRPQERRRLLVVLMGRAQCCLYDDPRRGGGRPARSRSTYERLKWSLPRVYRCMKDDMRPFWGDDKERARGEMPRVNSGVNN